MCLRMCFGCSPSTVRRQLENVYLFNGDIVDRGNGAADILVLLLLFKLWDPRCIHINRGSHEDISMNETSGFRDDCITK